MTLCPGDYTFFLFAGHEEKGKEKKKSVTNNEMVAILSSKLNDL